MARAFQVYVDTSVFGGCFDPPWEEASRRLLDWADGAERILLLSDTTLGELRRAPSRVLEVFERLNHGVYLVISVNAEIETLATRLVEGGAVLPGSRADALHVAAAAVGGADVLASWNFRHLVNVERVRKIHGILLVEGYRTFEIRAPNEVVVDG